MKLKITEVGVFDKKNEELEVGSVIDVKGDEIPDWLVNKVQKVDAESAGANKSEKVAAADAVAPFEAKHKGGQWYAITDGQGREVGKNLKKEDAEAFNAFSDEEKAQHVAGLTE